VTDTGGPRIAPLPVDRWDDDVREALQAGFGKEATHRFLTDGPDALRVPNALTTLLHHPELAGPFLAFNSVLLFTPALEPRLRELMVLRVAWRTRATYEWVQHVRLAQGCGVTQAEIEAIELGAYAEATWTPLEADLLAAADQMIDGYRIDDPTWARLAEHLDERQLVEVVFVVGTYTCLAMAFNSFGIELDPELRTLPAPPLPDSED
jgi:4-carboxymuconolactone decarboxylase